MSKEISRRKFLQGTAISAVGISSAAILGGCAPKVADPNQPAVTAAATEAATAAATEAAAAATPAIKEYTPSETLDTDVVVIGMGVTGILACCAAADKGAKVIGLDPVEGFIMTNASQTAGAWAVESSKQLACPKYLTKEWAFKFIYEGTHFQSNGKTLSAIINNSGRALDMLIKGGMPFMYPFEDQANYDKIGILNQGGHVWTVWGADRAKLYQSQMFDPRPNITTKWNTRAVKLLKNTDGAINGVITEGVKDGVISQINCKSVVVCTGGFVQNADMVKKYFAGARMIGPGNKNNNGAGITLCQEVGAQIGKNFSTSTVEDGSGNSKAKGLNHASGIKNSLFNLPLFGTLFVDNDGNRFMDESKMCEKTMYCGEPLLRDPEYYVVIDQAYVNKLKSTPITEFMGEQAIANMAPVVQMSFKDQTLTSIESDIAKGIEEKYVWKAETLDELQSATGLKNLKQTVDSYNGYASAGQDPEMYKDKAYMKDPVTTGPFYAIQLELACWLTLGGIKTNGSFNAMDESNRPIEGLYVAGSDADLWGVPYFQGGSAQGFCFTSGMLAGESAASKSLA
jgi:fumarate reductase flavoprotein subunit